MTSILSAVEGFAGVAIPAVGLIYTYTANRRAQYDRVLAVTDQSCTPPVSDDRHVAGTAFEPTSKHAPGKAVRLGDAEIKAVFNVLWYFGRADALYVSLRPPIRSDHITRAQRLLLDSLAAAIETWADYLKFSWDDEHGRKIDATNDTTGIRHLASEHARLIARLQQRTNASTGGELAADNACARPIGKVSRLPWASSAMAITDGRES